MTDDIDEVILQLERLAGLSCLPMSAREIILSFVDTRVKRAMEKVAEQARKYAESYEVDEPLFSPPKRQPRRRRWSARQSADHWRGLERAIRSEMPNQQGSRPRA